MIHKVEKRRLTNGLLISRPATHTKGHKIIGNNSMVYLPWSQTRLRIKLFQRLPVITPQHS